MKNRLVIFALATPVLLIVLGKVFTTYMASQQDSAPHVLTQCFSTLSEPQRSTGVVYKDEERGCYGQRWSLPAGYYSKKYISYHPITEELVLKIALPTMNSGASLPSEKYDSFLHRVNVRHSMFATFNDEIEHIKSSYRISAHLEKTENKMLDMQIYESKKEGLDDGKNYILIPLKDPELLLDCFRKPGTKVLDLNPPGGCTVISKLDSNKSIEYYLRNENISKVNEINSNLVTLLKSFMIN